MDRSSFFLTELLLLTLMLILLIIISLVVNRIYISGVETEHEQELNQNLTAFNASIESLYDEMKTFRHDYINIFLTTQGFIANDDYEGWKSFFASYIVPAFKPLLEYDVLIKNIDNMKIPSLKGLLLVKCIEAYERKIRLDVAIDENINCDINYIMDVNRVIGIFLDNAIDECSKKEGMLIRFIMYKNDNQVTVKVINELCGPPLGLSGMFKKGVSTKGEGRGLGLYNAQKLVARNSAMSLQTEINENEICLELIFTV
jgi:two-component system sensor histidine kinase AgrC